MEKINIAELLKDCPKGMKLDCIIYDNVEFEGISNNKDWPIAISVEGYPEVLNPYGCISYRDYTKCVIFPKGKTTWEGFHRPFEDGDIIYTKHKLGTEFISIFQIEYERDICTYWDINLSTNKLIGNLHEGNAFNVFIEKDKVKEQRFATEEEKEILFRAIKDNGYQWNTETKTLEKLPKFKVGDKIKRKGDTRLTTIKDIRDNCYIITIPDYFDNAYITDTLLFSNQNEYELVTNKFDITTLKPFESRVLIRDRKGGKWRPAIWGYYDNEKHISYPYVVVGGLAFARCIPYEGNEYLCGTTDDCNDFYKTW